MFSRYRIKVFGSVQGVGFRPFVYRIATNLNLKGYVLNNPQGVLIEVEGPSEALEKFLIALKKEKPPLAHIYGMELEVLPPKGYKTFEIKKSSEGGKKEVFVLPDIATCDECLKELFDPNNRRYRYPFINCTNCGPRFSIILRLPYDRKNTTMAKFKMCPDCEREYNDPTDRRFHAQPNACPVCGPWIELYTNKGKFLAQKEEALKKTADLLKEGKIVAIKGLGGFHLACDATNDKAVSLLRERKKRGEKPFAVMFKDIEQLKEYANITPFEEGIILSPETPIVLVEKKPNTHLSSQVAPHLKKIGVFLPYTPLHHLLLREVGRPLVMTSANISDEPIVKDNQEAFEKLKDLADCILIHNRDIANRVDDSVVRVIDGKRIFIRRSRGFAPLPITLPFKLKRKVLAVGGHKKNVVAIAWDNKVVLSQHIGDLETYPATEFFTEAIETLKRLYDFEEEVVVADLHPRYYSTRWAKEYSRRTGKKLIKVQHHFAHALSLMADAQVLPDQKILAITWDGTGYGTDGTVWGGEFLLTDYYSFQRVFSFKTFRLVGGEKAVKEPRRVALSILFELYGDNLSKYPVTVLKSFKPSEVKFLIQALKKGINAPLTSSVGRLFDAVASLLGIKQILSYEGQSGAIMEDLYNPKVEDFYPFLLEEGKINWKPLFEELIKDKSPTEVKISRFINSLAEIVKEVVLSKDWNTNLVGLTGGVFQNKPLTEKTVQLLQREGFRVLVHQRVPPSDGGLALGQAVYGGLSSLA